VGVEGDKRLNWTYLNHDHTLIKCYQPQRKLVPPSLPFRLPISNEQRNSLIAVFRHSCWVARFGPVGAEANFKSSFVLRIRLATTTITFPSLNSTANPPFIYPETLVEGSAEIRTISNPSFKCGRSERPYPENVRNFV